MILTPPMALFKNQAKRKRERRKVKLTTANDKSYSELTLATGAISAAIWTTYNPGLKKNKGMIKQLQCE